MSDRNLTDPAGPRPLGGLATDSGRTHGPRWRRALAAPLNDLPIGARLGISFGGVFLLMAAMAVFATLHLAQSNRRLTHIVEGNSQQAAQVARMIDSVAQRSIAIRNLALLSDPALKDAERRAIADAAEVYSAAERELLARIARFDASEAEKALLEAIKRSETAAVALMTQAETLAAEGRGEETIAFLMDKLRPRQARWITVLQTLSGLQAKTSAEYAADAAVQYDRARWMLGGFVGAALLAGMVLAWLVTRSIVGPIREAVTLARTAATGDLRPRPTARRGDEAGQLLSALQAMNENLIRVVGDVRRGSERIAIGTAEIAEGNADLSQRTERQAASLQQTASSMEELRATVRQNADAAREASGVADSASEAAARGGATMDEAVRTMQGITDASRRIADIIGVIDGIAFQTNILALNAAVEAARAGEQGRGFAVVASEVRSLAQRSAAAAREIRGLIDASTSRVDEGSRLIGDAGRTITGLVTDVGRVAALIAGISLATTQQTDGIGQVGDAVSELDRVTQETVALVEESSAAAGNLASQAATLLESVRTFRLESETA
ncbi:MAG: hypothetical protein RJA99_1802 [Pseudomonadota bacterium]|jgi:methyl-accepting chemotaxis protein